MEVFGRHEGDFKFWRFGHFDSALLRSSFCKVRIVPITSVVGLGKYLAGVIGEWDEGDDDDLRRSAYSIAG